MAKFIRDKIVDIRTEKESIIASYAPFESTSYLGETTCKWYILKDGKKFRFTAQELDLQSGDDVVIRKGLFGATVLKLGKRYPVELDLL